MFSQFRFKFRIYFQSVALSLRLLSKMAAKVQLRMVETAKKTPQKMNLKERK